MTAQRFHDHFSAVANRYADFRPHYPAALFDYLATLVPRNALVWDCACGNGQATIDLAERFGRVIATDASGEQIASATSHPKVDYRVATAESSGLARESVALLTVAQAIHWFDFDRFYAEAKRVLVPNGVLAVWSYGVNELEGEAANELAQDYYANIVGPYWPPERRLIEEGYRTIPFPFIEIVPPSIRMETHWDLDQLLGYFSTWSATNRFIKARGYNPLEQLQDELVPVWAEPQRKRRVTWPLSLRLGRK
jgi:SAM-dependent methyltransferase